MKNFLLLFMLSAGLLWAQKAATEKPVFVTEIEGIKEYSLSNGMQILLIPDNSQNNMVVNIVYKVGSRHEGYGEKGMAHLLEHMLFKSTKNMGDIKKQLTEKGGNANGTTWYDRTNYYEIFPSSDENLEWSLMMEADRMVNATILQSDLDKEFSVVRNEFEIGENDPGGVLMERVISAGFLWHNYGLSTIGSKEDIERVKADRLREFYKKYYQPNNATLIVGGNFNEDKALEYIEKYFSPLPARKLGNPTYTVEPPQDGERFVELKRTGDIQHLAAMYHTVPFGHEDYAALDALVEILTADPSGYIYKALVDEQKASSIWAFQPQVRDASFVYFNVDIPKDKSLEEAKAAFLSELDGVANRDYSEKDLERAKTKLIKYIEDTRNNTIRLAISLTEIVGSGDYKLGFIYRDRVEALTLDDINRVAQKYFRSNNRTFGQFVPSEKEERVGPTELSDDALAKLTKGYQGREIEEEDLSFEPTIANVKANMKEAELNNGMRYVHLNKPIKGNKVVGSFTFPTGTLDELKGKSTAANLMSQLLKSGTNNKSKEEIQDALDRMKSDLRFGWNGQRLSLRFTTYEEFLPEFMALIRECLTESTFSQEEFEKQILENKTRLENQLTDPQSIAFNKIGTHKQPYSKGHIFYSASPQEQLEAQAKLTRKEVVDFFNTYLGGNNGFGTLVGRMDNKQVQQLMSSTFGDWKTTADYERVTPTHYTFGKETERIVTPDKENGAAAGYMKFELDEAHPDYPAMEILGEIMGGGFITSRIATRLRENEGISYGAGSFMNVPISHKSASFGVYAFYNPSKVDEVEKALREEVARAATGDITQEELDEARTSWANSRKTWFTNDNQLAYLINLQLEFDKDIQSFDDLGSAVDKLTAQDINRVAKKYLDPNNLYLVMAGDFEK